MSERARRARPRVGIVYSESDDLSNESKYLAHFLLAKLILTNHATVSMIALRPNGAPISNLPNTRRVSLHVAGKPRAVEVPASDFSFDHWSSLESCHLVVITINPDDSAICIERMKETLQNKKDMVVFAMQRGVRSAGLIKDGLSGKNGSVVIECVVGFGAVVHATTGGFVSTIPNCGFAFERLSREIVELATGPVNLMEAMELDITYRKTLTPFAWGTIMLENLYALNVITGGTITSTLQNRVCRLLFASMLRENYKNLLKAARGGKWKADFTLQSALLTPWALEMILMLPQPLFYLAWLLLGVSLADVPSPGASDHQEGRRSCTTVHLQELVNAAKRNGETSPVCEAVLEKVKALDEAATLPGPKGGSAQHLSQLVAVLGPSYAKKSSRELFAWLFRGLTLLSIIFVVYFLFVHED